MLFSLVLSWALRIFDAASAASVEGKVPVFFSVQFLPQARWLVGDDSYCLQDLVQRTQNGIFYIRKSLVLMCLVRRSFHLLISMHRFGDGFAHFWHWAVAFGFDNCIGGSLVLRIGRHSRSSSVVGWHIHFTFTWAEV